MYRRCEGVDCARSGGSMQNLGSAVPQAQPGPVYWQPAAAGQSHAYKRQSMFNMTSEAAHMGLM